MLNIEREKFIIDYLKENGIIKLQNIIELLNISEATARRDLNSLEKRGVVKRVHGGAVLVAENTDKDLHIQYRGKLAKIEKEKIAKYASKYLKNEDYIFLDAGTTTEKLIKYLKNKDIKVVTNGINFIKQLEELKIETYLVGGKIKYKTCCTVGYTAVRFLENFNFDVVFMGANGFNEEGYSTPDIEEATLKQTAISRGKKVFFLCDSSKLEKSSFINFATLNSGVLITDKKLPNKYNKLIEAEVIE